MSTLKEPRDFLATLIESLQHTQPGEHPSFSSQDIKTHLLTLHVLYQRELIPALDLLDRKAVTRLRVAVPSTDPPNTVAEPVTEGCVYHVRSAQQTSNRGLTSKHRTSDFNTTTHYEVRLKAWTCSCPAFVFAAFPTAGTVSRGSHGGVFGQLTVENHIPMCKHILACVLIEYGGASIDPTDDRLVPVEELAGWAAGWGD